MKLHTLREPLEQTGLVFVASCADDGTPDISPVMAALVAAPQRLAMSCTAFDTTHANLRRNPQAALLLIDPDTGGSYRLGLNWQHTETDGAASHAINARLEYLAAHELVPDATAMVCTDVHNVISIETITAPVDKTAQRDGRQDAGEHLHAMRALGIALAGADDLSLALDLVLDGLRTTLGIANSLILCTDESGQWLYTVASRGYAASGVGSEVAFGEGLIGLCAKYRTPLRSRPDLHVAGINVSHDPAREVAMSDPAIPLPTLAHARCQIAVPILAGNWLGGVLYAESTLTAQFDVADEDVLVTVASQLATAMRLLLRQAEPLPASTSSNHEPASPGQEAMPVRYYPGNQSLFLGDDYLIKGVAGAILWLMLGDYLREGRQDFSNRELRMDARLRLPELDDNLETRLLLLQRRLAERCDWLRIDRPARGRLRLVVTRPLLLQQVDASNQG